MHDLEAEIAELGREGLLEAESARRTIALERGEVFSVFDELRFTMYTAVSGVLAGLGLVLKQNLDRIGPVVIVLALLSAAAVCYAGPIRTQLRGAKRSVGGDYLLLLGALILSADLGYAEAHFHWLGEHWSHHLLLLAVLHGLTAQLLRSGLVLSLALTSFASWFGVAANEVNVFQGGNALPESGLRAMACAGAVLIWREWHKRSGGASELQSVFEHFAANIAFWGALLWCFSSGWLLSGLLAVLALGWACIRKALRQSEEWFAVYGVGYASVGLCAVMVRLIREPMASAVLVLGVTVCAALLLWGIHERLKG